MNESTIDGVPAMILTRWQQAMAMPSIMRWRSLSMLCGHWWCQMQLEGESPAGADNVRMLSAIAYQHGIDMQPVREDEEFSA